MNKQAFIVILYCCIAFFGKASEQQQSDREMAPVQKLGYAERLIESYYVDTVNADKLVEQGIIAMLKTLDPHSTYTTAKETEELTTPLQGNFSGIGIQFNMVNDSLHVIQTTVGGPSEKVGILPGDRILSANDSILSGVGRQNSDILNILRGPKGTVVNVMVKRRNAPEPIRFRIVRDDIPLNSVDAAFLVNDSTGYIKVSRFAEKTAQEVAESLDKLLKSGAKNMIVDLQDNGGGYLNAAFEMASLFLPENSLVVYTDGPRVKRSDYFVETPDYFTDGRLVVLVNQYSASSSEIFAGAIQDNDRGVIVGRRTFGKGLVQRPFPFPDGSMIRLTISRYYTPSGRSIQKPYELGESEDYYMDMNNRYQHGEFWNADSVNFDDSLKVFTLNRKRPVYGGGGIMPDLFVPVDTTGYSDYYRDLTANGIINTIVVEYVDENRDDLKSNFSNETDFIAGFTVGDELIGKLKEAGEKAGIHYNDEAWNVSGEIIKAIIKGLIARDLWDLSGYYLSVSPVVNPIYNRGIEIIDNVQAYEQLLQSPSDSLQNE